MKKITVNTAQKYDVYIGAGLVGQLGERIATVCPGEAVVLVTDNVVNGLYGDAAEASLRKAGYATSRFVFPCGEQSKNIETYAALLQALAQAQLTRTDTVVALGGGVVGDLAGFAAATYLRGIRLVQIPTTLLAMVDASIGGKTAVDLPAGKNLAGAFYQPQLVLCDYDLLQTLSAEIWRDGCAEMIKHGIIRSAELFEMLKEPILPRLEEIIALNITIKQSIVADDEQDTGLRQLLNFGHTIGHGIEKLSGYSVSHGSAVACGMVITSRGAWRLGLCGEDCYREILAAVQRYQLPRDTDFSPQQLTEAAFYDKKRSGQQITLILPQKIGHCVAKNFNLAELASFIKRAMEAEAWI